MTIRIFILPTQYDIIDFRQGNRPENILVRNFATEAESLAYQDGLDDIGDQFVRVVDLRVTGSKVSYTRRVEDPDADATSSAAEKELKSPAEAEAYRQGLEDGEGLASPLVVDDTDDRFEQLQAWTGADTNQAVQ